MVGQLRLVRHLAEMNWAWVVQTLVTQPPPIFHTNIWG
jgi:hypothetical protein